MKWLSLLIVVLLVIPLAHARSDEENDSCGILDLAECIPEKLYDFFSDFISVPIQPLLAGVESLLTADVSIRIFHYFWSVIRYMLSLFYVFFFSYAGYVLLFANSSAIQRAHAKELLRNTVLMIIFINGSFYFYGLILELASVLNTALFGFIENDFFQFSPAAILNAHLYLGTVIIYAIVLFATIILLLLRYVFVSIAVVFLPIAIFMYFLPPLKYYGRFMLHVIMLFLFITTAHILIIITCSLMVDIPLLKELSVLFAIACFLIIDYTFVLAIRFATRHAIQLSVRDNVRKTIKYIGMMAA